MCGSAIFLKQNLLKCVFFFFFIYSHSCSTFIIYIYIRLLYTIIVIGEKNPRRIVKRYEKEMKLCL